ncbi:MAG: SprB repeat-containing protein [Flavobacteriales bacterium]|nr:SprB repeat-containing protein [Flavobacteriales bacterium]
MALLLFSAERAAAQALSASLTPSDNNGFAISCFGESDGSITANVSGGTPPYAYAWSHGDSVAQVSNLPAGYYKLIVLDSDTGRVEVDITLMQPPVLKVNLTPSLYPNDYNISCWNCFNGSLQTAVTGGVVPYQYEWNDGAVTSTRTGLGHKFGYMVVVVDANGCEVKSQRINLTQPDQEGWLKGGNSGTDASTHYLGTADSTDFVLKAGGTEQLRLLASGGIKMGLSSGVLGLDENGELRSLFDKPWCLEPGSDGVSAWYTCGNIVNTNGTNFIGTVNNVRLPFHTNNVQRMVISTSGKVGIGTEPPGGPVDEYRLFVEDGIATRDVLVKLGNWPDYVFADSYRLMPLSELREFLKRNKHLPGIPSAAMLEEQGGVALGEMQRNLVRTVEEQALYILELEERVKRLEKALH